MKALRLAARPLLPPLLLPPSAPRPSRCTRACASAARRRNRLPASVGLAAPARSGLVERRQHRSRAAAPPAATQPDGSGAPADADADEEAALRRNDTLLREGPIYVGVAAVVLLLLNRVLSGGALVADASSTQSRADVIVLALATATLLTGLQWKSVTPRAPVTVTLDGEEVLYLHPALSAEAAAELRWAWSALRATTRAGAAAVFFRGARAMQTGIAPPPAAACAQPQAPPLGPICAQAAASGRGAYLANTALYPGRVEFYPFMPTNAQGILVQPLGGEGMLVLATGTQRGFSALDQRWVAVLAQKLDSTLDATFLAPPPA